MTSQWIETKPRYASIPGVDPAVDWALGEGADYFYALHQQRQWMPILVQLKDIDPSRFQEGKEFLRSDEMKRWEASVRVSKLYIRPEAGARPFRFCTALVTKEFFELLLENPKLREFVARITLGLPLDRDALPAAAFEAPVGSQP